MAVVCLNTIAFSDGGGGVAGFSCDDLTSCFVAPLAISSPNTSDVLQVVEGEWRNLPLTQTMEWSWFDSGIVRETVAPIKRIVPHAGFFSGIGVTLGTPGTTDTIIYLAREGSADHYQVITIPAGETSGYYVGTGEDVEPGWVFYPTVQQAGVGAANLGIQAWYTYYVGGPVVNG